MIKKLFSGIAILAIALIMALNLNFSAKNNSLSDIILANVEALARREIGGENCDDWCTRSYFYDCALITNMGNAYICEYMRPK